MLRINIPEQCPASWADMQPDDQGRFCNQCQKTVIDFTEMTDEAVYNFLLAQKGKNVCGRMRATQLDRPIEQETVMLDPYWYQQLTSKQQLVYAIALFFILGMSACDEHNPATSSQQLHYSISLPKTKDSMPPTSAVLQKDSTIHAAPQHKKHSRKENPQGIEPEFQELIVQGGLAFDFPEVQPKAISIDSSKAAAHQTDTISTPKAIKKSHAFRAWLKKIF